MRTSKDLKEYFLGKYPKMDVEIASAISTLMLTREELEKECYIESIGIPEDARDNWKTELADLSIEMAEKVLNEATLPGTKDSKEEDPGGYVKFTVIGDSMDDGSRHSFEQGSTVIAKELRDRSTWEKGLDFGTFPYWIIDSPSHGILLAQIVSQNKEEGYISLHFLGNSFADTAILLEDIDRLYKITKNIPPHKDLGPVPNL